MQIFVYNIDDDWNFSQFTRRHLLHWHPALKSDRLLLSKKFDRYESEPEALPWPRVIDNDTFARIVINYKVAKELEELKVVAIIASSSNLSEAKVLIENFREKKAVRYFLFLRIEQGESVDYGSLVNNESSSNVFDLVFIIPDDQQKRLQSIALILDLMPSGQLFYDDYYITAGLKDRILKVNMDVKENLDYESSYREVYEQLNYWGETETEHTITTKEQLLEDVLNFHQNPEENEFKINDIKETEPKPTLSLAGFFYVLKFYNNITKEKETFDKQLSDYLKHWFRLYNHQSTQISIEFKEGQKQRLGSFGEKLKDVVKIELTALDDAIFVVNEAVLVRREEIVKLLEDIQADMTPESIKSVKVNNQENVGFKRKYFKKEEQAVDASHRAIKFPWSLQAKKKVFGVALLFILFLAITPLLILRLNQGGASYWQSYTMWLIDVSWLLLWLLPALLGLFISAKKRQKEVRKKVNILKGNLLLLLQRHQKACKAAERYSIVRLYLQELGMIEKRLQMVKKQKEDARKKIKQILNLTEIAAPINNQQIGAPREVNYWVSFAIEQSFLDQVVAVNVVNGPAPNIAEMKASYFLQNNLNITTFDSRRIISNNND